MMKTHLEKGKLLEFLAAGYVKLLAKLTSEDVKTEFFTDWMQNFLVGEFDSKIKSAQSVCDLYETDL